MNIVHTIYIPFLVYNIFVCRARRSLTTEMLCSEPVLCDDDVPMDEASILSAMFAQPLKLNQGVRDASINIEMAAFVSHGKEYCDPDASSNDQSRLLQPRLVDGVWADVPGDYDDENIIASDTTIRSHILPTIWYCVKNAFSMPSS